MQRILSTGLGAHVGETVTIAGWVHRRRVLKSVAFLIVRDAEGLAQVVVADPHELDDLPEESVVRVTGRVTVQAAGKPENGVAKKAEGEAAGKPEAEAESAPHNRPGERNRQPELVDPVIEVLSRSAVRPPFDLHRPTLTATLPTQLDHAALALRHPTRSKALRVSAAAAEGFRAALAERRFVEIHTPKIVGSATESGANVFTLDYFGRPGYLAQSPQFYKQLMVGVFERVFEVGPVFRAEPSDTARHLAQYTSLDAEMGFVADHRDVMATLTATLAVMMATVTERTGVPTPAVPGEIPSVHFADALAIAGAPADEPDLAPAHERALGEWARAEYGSEFVYVTGYPMRKRPFYTHPDPSRPTYSNGFDLLFRGLEIVTGGQRLHRYEDYVAALSRAGEPLGPYEGYLDGFRHGMPPHGGWAIGLERLVARILGLTNVREVTAFPRDMNRIAP